MKFSKQDITVDVQSSVRLVSPSLGEEPIQIISMRPMSDAEVSVFGFERLERD